MLKIRQGQPDDANALSKLAFESKAHWGYDKDFMEACRHELTFTPEDFPTYYFVVAEDPIVVGFYTLDFITNEKTELSALFVEPKYIGHGYGRALLNHAKIQTKVFGANQLIIASDPHCEGFYQTMGAENIGTRESESIPGRFLPLLSISL